jgi:hypothetical protein
MPTISLTLSTNNVFVSTVKLPDTLTGLVNATLAPAFKLLSAALAARTDDVACVIAMLLNYLFTCECNVLVTMFLKMYLRC